MVKYVQNRAEQIRVANACHNDVKSGHLRVAKTVARIKEIKKWWVKKHKQNFF